LRAFGGIASQWQLPAYWFCCSQRSLRQCDNDRSYLLKQIVEAHRYSDLGYKRGKCCDHCRDYWQALATDWVAYDEKKDHVARAVVTLLEWRTASEVDSTNPRLLQKALEQPEPGSAVFV
jgi:hypothetical protein